MLIILRLQSYSTSTHTNCLIQLLKSGWLRSFVSTEARILQRLLYLSSGYFKKFSKFLYQLQPLALRSTWRLTSAGGEFYSVTTCCQLPFSPLPIQTSEPKPFLAAYFVQLIDYQGVFRFVCAGSGANYRQIQRGVKHLFNETVISVKNQLISEKANLAAHPFARN